MSIRALSSSVFAGLGEVLEDDVIAGADKLGREVLASDLR